MKPKKEAWIKVIGVGGGGVNAVNHMFKEGIKDVEFVVCNTDQQQLDDSPIGIKVQLGAKLTQGLGAGTDPDKGREAAQENIEDIKKILTEETKMVFITSGMGGGTGTGAAPVIAKIAKEKGLLTVAIITAPYEYEGTERIENAQRGIKDLQEICDTVIVVLNDKLAELYPDMGVLNAHKKADDVLATAAKGIAEIITKSGKINVDFNDVKSVLTNAGQAVLGMGEAEGNDRAINAVAAALDSPLLNNKDIRGAKRLLCSVAFSPNHEMLMSEQLIITKYVTEKAGERARGFKLGYVIDDSLDKQIKITLIAAGFDIKEDTPWPLLVEEVKIENTVEERQQPQEEEIIFTEKSPIFDKSAIENLIEQFLKEGFSKEKLETPTYERNKVGLIDIHAIPSHLLDIREM